ncbi:MAG: glycosyltransferase family 2 protein [bacterium]|nr:glycosyltransferase family 2 protein [bacterium]
MAYVSVVIPVFNRAELTRQCLDSIQRIGASTPFEVIVVDNGSTDGTAEVLRNRPDWVRVSVNSTNQGFASACNQGAEMATGDQLLFLNNDTRALDDWLDPLVRVLESEPSAMIVGSRLLYEDGTIQHAGVVMSKTLRSPYHIYCGSSGNHPVVNRFREFRMVTGACMLVRRSAFEDAGGFDLGFRNGFEDVDLCLKIRAAGGRVFYEPKSCLYHYESQTPGRHSDEAANLALLLARWGGPEWADEDLCFFEDGMRCHTVLDDGKLAFRTIRIDTQEEHDRYAQVAQIQASLHLSGRGAVEEFLVDPDGWPLEPAPLEWAEQLCRSLGLEEAATRFQRKAEQAGSAPYGATSLPWVNRSQIRELRSRSFRLIEKREIPKTPFRPPAMSSRFLKTSTPVQSNRVHR